VPSKAWIDGWLLCTVLFLTLTSGAHRSLAETSVPLFNNLGTLHHPITTSSPVAQQYFDQGLRLLYAFNHEEAVNSFQEAARLDPNVPMPYWGVALALGPNINAAMGKAEERRALEAIRQGRAKLGQASPKERAYVEALTKRYGSGLKASRTTLDRAYTTAMRQVAHNNPDDLDAATLYAEALMDLSPWEYWTASGAPAPNTLEILATLEAVIQRDPNHPGACHYYIHAVEASPQPERAVPCAERLPELMPGAGHLVHMPAHIYMRTGRYHEASERNAQAASVDHEYLGRRKLTGIYPTGYYAHNLHFLWAALVMEGRSQEAMKRAHELVASLLSEDIRKDPAAELYLPTPFLGLARFGNWDDILRAEPPAKEFRYATGMWHFVRGLALAATGRVSGAEAELRVLGEMTKRLPRERTVEQKTTRALLKVGERVLMAELSARQGRYEDAVRTLKEAVQLEDRLPYSEPPLWFQPIRHNLGAILLAQGKAAEAETVYREDLARNPENGWALFGLAESLKGQNKTEEAAAVKTRFENAWVHADVTLSGSRF
jgi:tetratricopeptide (TPR) repeat protein